MSIPFELSYFVMGVSILNLLMVVAGLLLVYFEGSAARRREMLYLVFTEEKPGQSYFASARRHRALYTRLLGAFLVLMIHHFIEANLFATISEPTLHHDYLEWWQVGTAKLAANSPHAGAVMQAARMQVWWYLTEILALGLLGTSLLYEVRSNKRTTLDGIAIGLIVLWVVVIVVAVLGTYQSLYDLTSWRKFAIQVRDITFWLRLLIIGGVLCGLATQSRREAEDSAFSRSLLSVAFCAWLAGGLVSRLPASPDAPDVVNRMVGNPAALTLGSTVALLLLLAIIARHVLTEYEQMERSRHRLGRERQVIIAFLQRIGNAFSTAPEVDTVLDLILDSAIDTTEAHAAAIYLYDPETKTLGPPRVRHFFPPLYVDTTPAYTQHHGAATEELLKEATQQTFALGEGVIGEVAQSGRPRLIPDVREEKIVVGKTTQVFRDYSMLVAPLRVRDEPQAVIAVLQKQRGSFNQVDQALLQALADQGALVINHVRLLSEVREQERLRRELQIAHDIQQRLLPDRCPTVPGFEIGAYGAPATEVGGDYYDFFEVDKDHLGIVVADVSGKGVHAALVVAMMRSAFRIQARGNLDVKEVLESVNEFIGNDLPSEMFITCVYGILEVSTRRFTWARAGHEPLILAHPDDSTDVLAPAGFALGVLGSPDFDQMLEVDSVTMHPGDRILLFTDGLTEAMNAKGEEFGMQRILRVLSHADPALVSPNGRNGHADGGKKVAEAATSGTLGTSGATLSVEQSPALAGERACESEVPCPPPHMPNEPDDLVSMERAVENHVDGAPQSDDLTMVFLAAK